MNHASVRPLVALLAALALIATACGGSLKSKNDPTNPEIAGVINVSGSSTVEPISTLAKALFNADVSDNVDITVNGPGTSAGFKDFCIGATDINDASRAIKDKEADNCVPNVELRVAFDGIAVLVHPNNPLECVNFADLYALLGPESEGNTWDSAAAFAASLGSETAAFPTGEVDVIAPGTESGTYGSFIEIVLEHLGEDRAEEGAYTPKQDENGDDVYIRSDYAGQSTDTVILQGLGGTKAGIGWVGFAFAEAAGDTVKVLAVENEDGDCVKPSLETIADGTYPVSRSLYIYVNTDKAKTNPALEAFVNYYLGDGYEYSVINAFDVDAGYVTLPPDLKAETDARWTEAMS